MERLRRGGRSKLGVLLLFLGVLGIPYILNCCDSDVSLWAQPNKIPASSEELDRGITRQFIFRVQKFEPVFQDIRSRRIKLRNLAYPHSESSWDIEIEVAKNEWKRLAELAEQDFKEFGYREELHKPNRLLVHDWVSSFNPNAVFNDFRIAKLETIERDGIEQNKLFGNKLDPWSLQFLFVDAWNQARRAFAEEMKEVQLRALLEGTHESVQILLSRSLILDGLRAALKDNSLQMKLKAVLTRVLTSLKKPHQIDLNEKFATWRKNQEWNARLSGKLIVVPDFDPKKAEIEISVSDEAPSKGTGTTKDLELPLGFLKLKIPVSGLHIESPQAQFASRHLPKTLLSLQDSDRLAADLVFREDQPLELEGDVVWSKIFNRPDFNLNFKRFTSPFRSAKIKSWSFRGKKYGPETLQPKNILKSKEAWDYFQSFEEVVRIFSDQVFDKLQTRLQEVKSVEQEFVLIDRHNEIPTGNTAGESPVDSIVAEEFDPHNPEHDPAQNKKIIAKFRLEFPIEIQKVAGNIDRGSQASLQAKSTITIKTSQIIVKDFQLFQDGSLVSNRDLGFKFNIARRMNGETTSPVSDLDLSGRVHASDLDELAFEVDPVKAKINGLYVDEVSYRIGNRWQTSKQIGLDHALQNIALIRQIFTRSADQTEPTELGRQLENDTTALLAGLAKTQIRSIADSYQDRFAKDAVLTQKIFASEWKVPVAFDVQKWKISGFRVENLSTRFLDLQSQGVRCSGDYLFSTHLALELPKTLGIQIEDAKVSAVVSESADGNFGQEFIKDLLERAGADLQANLKIKNLNASLAFEGPRVKKRLPVDASFDLCLNSERDGIDLQLRDVNFDFENIRPLDMKISGADTDSPLFKLTGNYIAWKAGMSRDQKLTEVATGLLKAVPGSMMNFFMRWLEDQLRSNLAEWLASEKVKPAIDRQIMTVNKTQNELASFLWNFGKKMQPKLEEALTLMLQKTAKEYEPKVNEALTGRMQATQDLFGSLYLAAVHDFESLLLSKTLKTLYSPASNRYLTFELERILKPLNVEDDLSQIWNYDATHSTNVSSSPAPLMLAEQKAQQTADQILHLGLERCPFSESVDAAIDRLDDAFRKLTYPLNPVQERKIKELILASCMPAPNSRSEQLQEENSLIGEWVKAGFQSAQQAFMAEGNKKYFQMKDSDAMPLRTGPENWHIEDGWSKDRQHARDFIPHFEMARAEMLNPWANDDIFMISLFVRELSNILLPMSNTGLGLPFIQNALKPGSSQMVIRASRFLFNQLLASIDWPNLIAHYVPEVKSPKNILVEQIPYINDQNQIEFLIWHESQVMIAPVLKLIAMLFFPKLAPEALNDMIVIDRKAVNNIKQGEILKFLMSVFNLSIFNPSSALRMKLGIKGRVQLYPSIVKDGDQKVFNLEFGPVQVDAMKAPPIVDRILADKVNHAHLFLNAKMREFLQEVAKFNSFQWLQNDLDVESVDLIDGDVYLILNRSDLPDPVR